MVIDQIDIVGVAGFKAKDHAPIPANRDAPESFQSPTQAMKAKSWQIQIAGVARPVENKEHAFEPFCLIGAHAAVIVFKKQSLKPFMLETPNHMDNTLA